MPRRLALQETVMRESKSRQREMAGQGPFACQRTARNSDPAMPEVMTHDVD